MYFVLFGLFSVGWLLEASAVLLGRLKLLASLFPPLLGVAPAPEGEDFAALADVLAAVELPLEAAADEPLEADVELAPLGVVADVELPPCCHAGAVLFSCNYYCGTNFSDT